jgi:hypothetical protein
VKALQRRFVGEPGFGVGTGTIPDTDEYLTSTSLVLAGGKSTDEAERRTKNLLSKGAGGKSSMIH